MYFLSIKLSFSATTPLKNHLKVLSLLVFIQIACCFLIICTFMATKNAGISVGLFMFAEVNLKFNNIFLFEFKKQLTLITIHKKGAWVDSKKLLRDLKICSSFMRYK